MSKFVTEITPTNTLKKYQLKAGLKYPNGETNLNSMRTDDKGRAFFTKAGQNHYVTHEDPSQAITDDIIEALYPDITRSRFFELKKAAPKKATK